MRPNMFVIVLMVTAVEAEDVLVCGTVELKGAWLGPVGQEPADVRWSGQELLLQRNRTVGCGGRCSLLSDGALRLTDAQFTDSGLYRQEVFSQTGKSISRKDFRLTVYGRARLVKGQGRTWAKGWTPLGLSLVLAFIIIIIIIIIFIRRKRALSMAIQWKNTDSNCLEENPYVPMFRARDQKAQCQEETGTKTHNQPQTKPDPEEDVYV